MQLCTFNQRIVKNAVAAAAVVGLNFGGEELDT